MLEDNALDESETTLFQLSSGLTRLQAAKLFYQICGKHTLTPASKEYAVL